MNMYLAELSNLDESDQDTRLTLFGNLEDAVRATRSTNPDLKDCLHYVVRWLLGATRTWDDREAALGVLLEALEYDLLAGVDLEPVEKLQPSLDDELKRYVDDLFERGPPPSK